MFPQKHTIKGLFYAYIQKVFGLGVFAFLLLSIIFIQMEPAVTEATTSSTLNFQGRLLSSSGGIVPDGYYNLQFKLYDGGTDGGPGGTGQANAGTNLWTESYYDSNGVTAGNDNRVRIVNGYFSVNLGSQTSFPGTINWDQELWLTMNVGGSTQTATPTYDGEMLGPSNARTKLTAVPYAFAAGKLVGSTGSVTADDLVQLSPSSIQGTSSATSAIRVNQTGAGGLLQLQSAGTDVFDVSSTGGLTSAGNGTFQGGGLTLGTASQTSTITLYDGSSNTATIGVAPLGANFVLNVPNLAAGTYEFCTTSGNCNGLGDILQGGNNYGTAVTIGTNDNYDVNLESNNITRVVIEADGDLAVDTDTLFVDAANNRVGIGTASPSAQLHISGAGGGTPLLVVTDTTATARDVLTIADGGAITFRNQTDSTSALRVQNSAGTSILNIDSTNSQVSLQGNNTDAVDGSDLITSNDFSNATYWTCAGWTTSAFDATHNTGNSNSCGATASNLTITAGSTYWVKFNYINTINSGVAVSLGGVSPSFDTYSMASTGTFEALITATSTAGLSFLVGSSDDVTVSNVQVYEITKATSVLDINNSDGTTGLEVRAGGTGQYNTFIGLEAGRSNSVYNLNSKNTALGAFSLQNNTYGFDNTASGAYSLQNNVSGFSNTVSGVDAMRFNTSGYENSAFGKNSLNKNVDGQLNSAFGAYSLENNVSGDYNTAIGHYSLNTNITGNSNTALGHGALSSNATGDGNVGIGLNALSNNIGGSYNLGLGYYAGFEDGSFATSANLQNATAIGAYSQVQQSDSLILGRSGSGSAITKIGIGTTAPTDLFSISPDIYDTGTAETSASATVVGTGTTWTTDMVGNEFIFANGNKYIITGFTDATHMTLSASSTNASQDYRIHNRAFYVTGTGSVGIRTSSNSTTAFNVQNSSGNTLLNVDTTGSNLSLGLTGSGTTTINSSSTVLGASAGSGLLVNNGATRNTALALTNFATGGSIGTAATTVDIYTYITVNQTTASQTLTVPAPTVTTSGRFLYLTNVGSADFSLTPSGGSTFTVLAGTSLSLIWDGSKWTSAGDGAGGVNAIGAIDGGTYSANGASISGTTLYLQNASATQVGLVNTTTQTFAGDKTFNGSFIVNPSVAASTISLGSTTQTGTITLGQSTATNTITIGSSAGASATQTINIGTSVTASSTTTINIGSTVAGVTTLQSQGGVKVSTLGVSTVNSAALCRDTSTNLLTACDASNTTGKPFLQGGNTFGALATLGTNDAFALSVKTNNTVRASFSNGNTLYLGNADSSTGLAATPNSFTLQATGSSTAGTAGGALNIYTGAGNTTGAGGLLNLQAGAGGASGVGGAVTIQAGAGGATSGAGGLVTIAGGDATGTNSNGGNVTIGGGLNTGSGTAGTVIVRNDANSTSAFSVQNASGWSALSVNTADASYAYASLGGTGYTHAELKLLQGSTYKWGFGVDNSGLRGSGSFYLWNNSAGAYNLGIGSNGAATFHNSTNTSSGFLVENSSSQPILNVDTSSGRIGINTSAPSADLTFGEGANRTINVLTRTTNAIGNNLTISAGAAGSGASAFAGGSLTLQGGAAGGTGNANGGDVNISGGAATGASGYQGVINLSTTAFNTAPVQTISTTGVQAITAGNQNIYSTLPITASVSGVIATIGDPGQSVIGRIVYVTARSGSQDFTLRLNSTRTPIDINMKANSTATLIWNGTDWTAAGASSSTDLQAAYNNTLSSAGAAELLVSQSSNADGLTIRNSSTSSITGALLEVQSSIGSSLFSVNNNATEYASNGGAESSTFTAWTAAPAGGTVSRTTTANEFATGQAATKVVTAATTSQGVANTLTSALTPNLQYNVAFTVRGSANFTTLDVIYSRDGTNTSTTTCATSQTVTTSVFSRVNCSFTAPSSGITASNAIFIRQSDAVAHTYYIDNLSVTVNASVNHASDGSADSTANIGGGTLNWAAVSGSTVTQSTSVLYDTSGSVSVATAATSGRGVYNKLSNNIAPSVSTQYRVAFYARGDGTNTANLSVLYTPDNGTNTVACQDYNTQTVAAAAYTLVSCYFTSAATSVTNAQVRITQSSGSATTFYVDALTVTLNNNNSNNVQIGGGSDGGPATLFTLDRSNGAPIAANNDAYLGSMYYDTTTGRIQCYEADGWGACGAAPDNYVNLNPEYAGAVLNGTGVGTMTADICSNDTALSINSTLCSTGQAKNYYKWTSPQATQQTYSIYVTYQLPATFNGFSSDDTVQLVARTDSTSNAAVTYQMFKSTGSAVTQCGTGETTVVTSANTWQSVGINGNESTGCSFNSSSASNFVIFKINLKANSNANAYVSTLSFVTTGR